MAHITELPVEMTELIGEYLDRPDLLPLRLPSQRLATKLSGVFAIAFFTNVSFILACKVSMETLRDISAHPIYGKFLRRIRFYIGTLPNPLFDRQRRDAQIRRVGSCLTRTERKTLRHQFEELYRQQCRFRDGPDLECMKDILNNLKKAKNTPAVVTTGSEDISEGFDIDLLPWGSLRISRVLGYDFFTPYGIRDEHPLHVIWEAILKTGFLIRDLEIGTVGNGLPLWFFRPDLF